MGIENDPTIGQLISDFGFPIVMAVGMGKGLGDYSKTEIVGLVDIVLESYHQTLQELYKDEVPF